jgi:hypothetical protein
MKSVMAAKYQRRGEISSIRIEGIVCAKTSSA